MILNKTKKLIFLCRTSLTNHVHTQQFYCQLCIEWLALLNGFVVLSGKLYNKDSYPAVLWIEDCFNHKHLLSLWQLMHSNLIFADEKAVLVQDGAAG